MKFFDAHCHLQFPQYDQDRDGVLTRMKDGRVGGVVIGTDLETSKRGVELARTQDFLWASVGLHPNDNIDEIFDEQAFEQLAQDPKVVAIGECGLDYFRSGGTLEEKTAQQKRFEKQIALAHKVKKTLIIHCRNAHDDVLSILKNSQIEIPVVIHFFTGSAELAQKYLDLGCHLSFPGPITYTDMYDESIRIAPPNKILAETDAPFAAPVPFRGKRNEPAFVEYVVNKIAQVKNLQVREISAQIILNSQRVFNIEPKQA
ncbi:MAG TPA: TatD family hydrolase [Candidatus Paceibacterota bacterium]|nr:TatD family hydrolase [Candidatus Paceibacterota bacterium]